jgi:hypothetical protein
LNFTRLVLALSLFTSMALGGPGQGSHHASREQTEFSAEDQGVKNPVPVPDSVMALLGNEVRGAMQTADPPITKPPASWFSASKVSLGPGKLKDLIVVGEPPLSGGNTQTFWVFRNTGNGYELVLTAPAHDLRIKDHRSKGYRDIEMSAETAVELHSVLFRFDGKHYVNHREKLEPIR